MSRMILIVCFMTVNCFLTWGKDSDADANIIFHVTDDMGVPVENAKVNVYFDMHDRSQGRRCISNTNSNGVCQVQGRTSHTIEIEVTKPGYYATREDFNLHNKKNFYEIKWGKWQPWGIQKKITLPKIRNQVAICPSWKGVRYTKRYNEWIGFDIFSGDYVIPHGKGVFSDFEVYFGWDGKTYREYNGMTMRIRFAQKGSGMYWTDKFIGTDMTGVYQVETNAVFMSQCEFYEKLIRDSKGRPIAREQKLVDKSKVLVGRIRCKYDEHDELTSAIYFQIPNLDFSCGRDGAGLWCLPYYNPIPNDTNIEPKK